jgi:hypothetical protein
VLNVSLANSFTLSSPCGSPDRSSCDIRIYSAG